MRHLAFGACSTTLAFVGALFLPAALPAESETPPATSSDQVLATADQRERSGDRIDPPRHPAWRCKFDRRRLAVTADEYRLAAQYECEWRWI